MKEDSVFPDSFATFILLELKNRAENYFESVCVLCFVLSSGWFYAGFCLCSVAWGKVPVSGAGSSLLTVCWELWIFSRAAELVAVGRRFLSYWTRISLNHLLSLLYPHFSYFYLRLASSGAASCVANGAKPASGLTQFLQQVVFHSGLCWLPQ